MSIRELTRKYYQAWAAQNREAVLELLDPELSFTSPQDRFESAESFLQGCWIYSTGLAGVSFIRGIYADESAFVILRWHNQDGGSFMGAEYLTGTGGRINEILVVNNDPSFADLFAQEAL
ncbi:MAG: nuclear transport factor 2 family protein [Candidatus Delongbacteria bacterium]|nr:nuclear transport factor 2 family protein [bacterium]MBL7032835.1 nuclear transport factor 2 family protein [Candidatus Delongbacteria bacterium]